VRTPGGVSHRKVDLVSGEGLEGALSVVSLTIDDGRIAAVDIVRNPKKASPRGGAAAMRSPRLARGALAVACAYALVLGAIAAFAPRTFYDHFPFIGAYVKMLPPYNEHLVTDVGGLYLGFAVIFGWAAWRPERNLILAASTGFLLAAVLHLVFHASHLDGFSTSDAVNELGGLALLLVPPGLAIWAVAEPRGAA
jgi:hypothetical protein